MRDLVLEWGERSQSLLKLQSEVQGWTCSVIVCTITSFLSGN